MSVLTLDIERITKVAAGVIKPNKDGIYKIIVGGLNIYSPNGFYYKYTKKIEKILTSGTFKLKLDANKILSEDDHPNFSIYPTEKAVVERMLSINESNAVAAIVNIEVKKSDKIDPIFKEPLYYIIASIKPTGPKKQKLIDLLANPDKDICFSVRSFSDKYEKNGIVIKEQKLFITWDMVTQPGHFVAKKSYTNGIDIESVQEITFTEEGIKDIRASLLDKLDSGLDLESTNNVNELLGVFDICPEGDECLYKKW